MKRPVGPPLSIPLSRALVTNDMVFVSGQVPDDLTGDIEQQSREVLDKVAALLREAGSSLEHVVKTTVFLRETADFERMNAIYAEYFPSVPPTRSTVRVDLMVDARIEIEAIALRAGGQLHAK